MANPITWRNVTGGGNTGHYAAAQILNSAGNRFDSAFDGLRGIMDAERATNDANRDTQIDNNTAAYLDKLASYQSADAFNADRANIDAMRSQFGNLIDRNQTRGAFNSTLDTLNTRADAALTREDAALKRQADPIRQQIEALRIANRDTEANALQSENQDLLARTGYLSGLTDFADKRDRTEVTRQREDATNDFTVYNRNRQKDTGAKADDRETRRTQIDTLATSLAKEIEAVRQSGRPYNGTESEVYANALANIESQVQGMDGQDKQYARELINDTFSRYLPTAGDQARSTQLDAQLIASVRDNPYYREENVDPVAAVAEWAGKRNVEDGEIGDIAKILQNGMTVDGIHHDVTPNMLNMVQNLQDFWIGGKDYLDAGDVKSALKDLLRSETFAQKSIEYQQFKKDRTKLAEDRLKTQLFSPR